MGKPKHGKDSARAKACKKYKDSGRKLINKEEKKKKLAAGKKIKSHKTTKTKDMMWDNLIKNTEVIKPYYDSVSGKVKWGTEKEVSKKKSSGTKNKDKK